MFCALPQKILRYQTELITYEAVNIKRYKNVCFFLVVWHTKRIFSTQYYTVMGACLAISYFPHYLINGPIFGI